MLYGPLFHGVELPVDQQKFVLLEYFNTQRLGNGDFIELYPENICDTLEQQLEQDDILVLPALSFLAPTLLPVITLLESLLMRSVTVMVVDAALKITSESLCTIELLHALHLCHEQQKIRAVSLRRSRLKKRGVKVGRREGVLVKSIFDPHRAKIEELYALGLSMSKIVEHIKTGTQQSLYHYIKSRGIER